MKIEKLSREQLIELKSNIDLQISQLEREEHNKKLNSIKSFEKLSDMKRGGDIFCINFSGEKIYNMDFVHIDFSRNDGQGYTRFGTSHETKPMGCSSWINDDDLSNHCFLSEFCGPSYYFFTLKPKTWREDLMWELKKMVSRKKKRYGDEIKNSENTVKPLLKSSEQVDDFITKYQENKKS